MCAAVRASSVPDATASTAYGGQITFGPDQSGSYRDIHGSGMSNGSCGSNSSTNRKNRSAAGAWRASHAAAAAIVRAPGKSCSSRNHVRVVS